MEDFINKIIEEKFASKSQQRFFYAQAGKGGKKGKKWSKWTKEFSADTDFKNLPEKKKKEVDEIVDEFGNIKRSKKPVNFNTKGTTSKKTTDDTVKASAGSMGNAPLGPFGRGQQPGSGPLLRYWGEGKEYTKDDIIEIALNKALGADQTIMKDKDYEEAKDHMEDDLGIPEDEAEDRLEKMGYDEDLPEDKVRLIEKSKSSIEEFIESIISKKREDGEFVKKGEKEIKEVSPIIKRQLKSLTDSLKSHGLSFEDVLEYLKDNE
jgi:hypothetical protein